MARFPLNNKLNWTIFDILFFSVDDIRQFPQLRPDIENFCYVWNCVEKTFYESFL